jgi:hypothetical protein
MKSKGMKNNNNILCLCHYSGMYLNKIPNLSKLALKILVAKEATTARRKSKVKSQKSKIIGRKLSKN